MDHNWISTTKPGDREYAVGVKDFINFALRNSELGSKLPCPCYICHNLMHHRVDVILKHLGKWAFDRTYTRWIWHGESKEGLSASSSIHNVSEAYDIDEGDRLDDMLRVAANNYSENPAIFEILLHDSEKPVYTGSKNSKLSSVLRLYNLKAGNGWTDKSFSELLLFLKEELLLEDNVLPNGTYEAKKILSSMGLKYERIHACPKD